MPRRMEIPQASPEIAREDWRRDVAKFERDALFTDLRDTERAQRLTALRDTAKRGGFDARFLAIFDGMALHETADEYRMRFLVSLADELGDPALAGLTPDTVGERFARFSATQNTAMPPSALEERAMASYAAARASGDWPTARLTSSVAVTLQSDLEYLRALRIPDDTERTVALKRIEADLGARAIAESNVGIRAEHQVTWLLRRWTREQGLAHRIVITHALPKDDYGRGVDLLLDLGSRRFRINLKTLKLNDTYTEEHQSAILQQGKAKAAADRSYLVAVNSDTLRTVWKLATQTTLDDTEHRRLQQAKKEFFASFDAAGTPVTSFFRPAPHARERTRRPLTEQQLKKLVSASVLRAFGVLPPDALADPKKYLDAQQRFLRAAKGRISNADDLAHPSDELQKEIRQIMES